MIDACFITVNPFILLGASIVLTICAMYIILTSFRGEPAVLPLLIVFLGLGAASWIYILCWAVVISALELALSLALYRAKVRVLSIR